MRQLTQADYKAIVNIANKYGIESEGIKIYHVNSDEYAFLVKPKKNTSAFQFIGFQHAISQLLGDEGEEIDVVTEAGLDKRVQQYEMTFDEKINFINGAKLLSDLFPTNNDEEAIDDLKQLFANECAFAIKHLILNQDISSETLVKLQELAEKLSSIDATQIKNNLVKFEKVIHNGLEEQNKFKPIDHSSRHSIIKNFK